MNGRKTLTALAAALLMITVSAPVSAFECGGNDPATIADNLELLAIEVRCDSEPYKSDANPGNWPTNNPIWERRRAGSCDVHQNLAAKLFQDRELDENSTKPRKNQFNSAEGAALSSSQFTSTRP